MARARAFFPSLERGDGWTAGNRGSKFVNDDGRRCTIAAFNTTLNTIQNDLPRDHRDKVSWTMRRDGCISGRGMKICTHVRGMLPAAVYALTFLSYINLLFVSSSIRNNHSSSIWTELLFFLWREEESSEDQRVRLPWQILRSFEPLSCCLAERTRRRRAYGISPHVGKLEIDWNEVADR